MTTSPHMLPKVALSWHWPIHPGMYDTTPHFSDTEAQELETLIQFYHRAKRLPQLSADLQLQRLLHPIVDLLDLTEISKYDRYLVVNIILREMHQSGQPFWAWSEAIWTALIGGNSGTSAVRYPSWGNGRQYLMALAHLKEMLRLPTSGARAVERFILEGEAYLAIPQLAEDLPQTEPNINGGNSNTAVLLYRRAADTYVEQQRLSSPGGEDAEFFSLGERYFLAIASIRSGKGPYQFAIDSVIYEWRENRFEEFQRIPTVAAKQWRHFTIGERHFLALAQGVALEGVQNVASQIYEWNGTRFEPFQEIPSQWAYNWHFFAVEKELFLAHADHIQPSVLYRWNGSRFEPFQSLIESQGRAFTTFEMDGATYLICARLQSAHRCSAGMVVPLVNTSSLWVRAHGNLP